MRVPTGNYRLGDAVYDGTGLTQEEIGWLIAAAAVATGVLIAVRAADVVMRLWTPSGGRS
jgi:alkylhydroperoxidase/carboxymuconolactone decarboxylase family protein YurZ